MYVCRNFSSRPNDGIKFRRYSIPELQKKLPKGNVEEPLPEGLFWLMLTGELPTEDQVSALTHDWIKRSEVPAHTFAAIDALPLETHPMIQYSIAIASMQTERIIAKKYAEGINRLDYWDTTSEDTMNLIARLPKIAAYIYRRIYHDNQQIPADPSLDWAGNFAHMLGNDEPVFQDLMSLYLTMHAYHVAVNAGAIRNHLVGSTLSDTY